MHANRHMKRFKYILLAVISLSMALLSPSCVDDGLGLYDGPNDGEANISLDVTFSPFSTGDLNTRANIENGNGKALNQLQSMCILVYDTDGKFVGEGDDAIIKVDLTQHPPTDSDRVDNDASNNHSAEKKTLSVKDIKLRLPFGRYYIVAVANLKDGTRKKLTETLGSDGEPVYKKLDELRKLKVDWNNTSTESNGEMMGYFTDSELKDVDSDIPAYDRPFKTVAVNRGGMKLHSWLRRCASKITIDFDGSGLRESVSVYIKEARIYDVAYDCTLGFGQQMTTKESESSYNHRVRSDKEEENGMYHESAQVINYVPIKTDESGSSAATEITGVKDVVAQGWPHISKGMPVLKNNSSDEDYETATPIDFHAETADALYFYENMQPNPEGKTRVTQADLENGGVANDDVRKDGITYGTYIEVEGYYSSDAYGNSTHGKIIYRFMLGKNVTDNFEAERNYHYKLTLCPRGNGNDADWHIEFEKPKGFHVPNPWYVSYLYNHDAMLPFSFEVPDGCTLTGLKAEIVKNPWYPTNVPIDELTDTGNPLKPVHPYGDEEAPYETNTVNKGDYNGFLSLRVTNDVVVTDEKAGLKWIYGSDGTYTKPEGAKINEKYYYGGKTNKDGIWETDEKYEYKIDRSQRVYLENGNEKTYDDYPKGTSQEIKDRDKFSYRRNGNTYSFDIPLFTRAKVLVKPTAYSGNNPFVGYQRVGQVKLTATYKDQNGNEMTEHTLVNVVQVRRVVNPKGVYRDAGNNEPFHVTMMWLDGDDKSEFSPVISHGPWRADIIGSNNFITLDGKQSVSGSTDEPISFTIRFNRMNNDKNDKTVRYAVVRIKYHNYTCTHLIFVRQGYSPDEIVPSDKCRDSDHENYGATPTKWRVFNMIHGNLQATDPRDEGSLFKFGNAHEPIDAYNNVYRIGGKEVYHNLTQSEFTDNPNKGPFNLVDGSGNLSQTQTTWADIKKGTDFSASIPKTATMRDFEQLYLSQNVQFGYGVLYADGATKTQEKIEDAYGYYRRDTESGKSPKGMRGLFAYYWDGRISGGDPYNARNVFFPIGRSGYGHRKNSREGYDGKSPGEGVLRYSCTRGDVNEATFSNAAPLFVSIYRRPGAIYWSKFPQKAQEWNWVDNVNNSYGLDINYFSFDVNLISAVNVSSGEDACFVRCVGDE